MTTAWNPRSATPSWFRSRWRCKSHHRRRRRPNWWRCWTKRPHTTDGRFRGLSKSRLHRRRYKAGRQSRQPRASVRRLRTPPTSSSVRIHEESKWLRNPSRYRFVRRPPQRPGWHRWTRRRPPPNCDCCRGRPSSIRHRWRCRGFHRQPPQPTGNRLPRRRGRSTRGRW